MADRREGSPESAASRAGWGPTGHARAGDGIGYASGGYAYSSNRSGDAVPPPASPPSAGRHAGASLYGMPRHGADTRRTRSRRVPHAPAGPRIRARRADASPWNWLLLVPIVLPLIPAIYNRIEPTLFGIPFFYWGQLAFAFLASAVIAFVHLMVR